MSALSAIEEVESLLLLRGCGCRDLFLRGVGIGVYNIALA